MWVFVLGSLQEAPSDGNELSTALQLEELLCRNGGRREVMPCSERVQQLSFFKAAEMAAWERRAGQTPVASRPRASSGKLSCPHGTEVVFSASAEIIHVNCFPKVQVAAFAC